MVTSMAKRMLFYPTLLNYCYCGAIWGMFHESIFKVCCTRNLHRHLILDCVTSISAKLKAMLIPG